MTQKIAVKVKIYAMFRQQKTASKIELKADLRPVGQSSNLSTEHNFNTYLTLHRSIAQQLFFHEWKTRIIPSQLGWCANFIRNGNCCRTEQSTYTISTLIFKIEVSDGKKIDSVPGYHCSVLIIYTFDIKNELAVKLKKGCNIFDNKIICLWADLHLARSES